MEELFLKTCCIACCKFHFFGQKISHRGYFFKFFRFVLGSSDEFSFLFLILFIIFSFVTIKLVTYKNGIGNWLLLYDSSLQLYSKELKNIFFGIGFKNYKSKCIENKNLVCSTHPHHYLIEFLVSFGLVGLSLFIFYFYKVIFYLLINRTHNREYLIFIFIFFFPFLPSGSIFSINVLSTLAVFSSLFLAHQYISKKKL